MIDPERHSVTLDRHRLVGRDDTVDRVVAVARSASAPPLLVVTGLPGIGRTATLRAARDRLRTLNHHIIDIRLARNERDRPFTVAGRLIAELDAVVRGDSGRVPAAQDRRTIRSRCSAANAPAVRGLVFALEAAVDAKRPITVFIDDLHWIDTASLAALPPLVHLLAGSAVTVVAGWQEQVPMRTSPAWPVAGRLIGAGSAEVLRLRPLRHAQVGMLASDLLAARPSADVVDTVMRLSRGVPGAVRAAVQGLRQSGSVQVIDRNAYLAAPHRPLELSSTHGMFESLRRRLDGVGWSVVKAVAVLHPLGDIAVSLAAEAVGVSTDTVTDVLRELQAHGVVLEGPKPDQWRFRLPVVGMAPNSCLGPYERRRLAQLAVDAIWAGRAAPADNRYLPEQLVAAGALVDTGRAAAELLARGAEVLLTDEYAAPRWLGAATELITDPGQRAWALALHASACVRHNRYADAKVSSWTALTDHADLLTPDALMDVEILHLSALLGLGDTDRLTEIATDAWRSMPGGDGHRAIVRGTALYFLGRWAQADHIFTTTRPIWRNAEDTTAAFGLNFGPSVAAYRGRPAELFGFVADPGLRPRFESPRQRSLQLSGLTRSLMTFGEMDRARTLSAEYGLPSEQRHRADLCIEAALTGRWDEAIELARVSLAGAPSLNIVPSQTVMCREVATVLCARGWLTQARAMIEQGRSRQQLLVHLFAVPEAEVERVLGATAKARGLVVDALALAGGQGLVVGTDELWLRMAEWADGDQDAASRALAESARVADVLGTGRARLCRLLADVAVRHESGAEAVALARRRDLPFELAGTLERVATAGGGEDSLLLEAYAIYGELDALLPRARLRGLMRERDISVAGRSATVAENERLLAALVTDGLTNRELGVVLGASEKSVEGRLTRLFQRTGYRSRVELATAMVTGEYPG